MDHCGNQAPVLDETAYSFTISEAAVAGDVAGTVSAFDRNADSLTFSVTGTDKATFNVDAVTGDILVIANRLGLGSDGTEYTVTVKASDGDLSDTATVTITATAWECLGKAVYGEVNTDLLEDCATMIRFRDRLAGTAALLWSDRRHIESPWVGVEINWSDEYPDLRVTEILLEDMNLNGVLPAEIADLDGLHLLDLSDNDLTGPIPWQLGELDDLDTLYLSGNNLSGCIPPGLKAITNNDLNEVDLPTCTYDGQIPAPANLSAATSADGSAMVLSWDAATGAAHYRVDARPRGTNTITPDWTTLTDSLTGTSIEYSGANCGRNLEFKVWAYADGVAYAPAWSESARSEHIPAIVGDCKVLLDMRDALVGDGDAEVNWSASLDVFRWNGIEMDRIYSDGGDNGRVVTLSLVDEGLEGTIPADIGKLTGLTILALAHNDLTGAMPEEIGNLTNLHTLSLGNNDLNGSLPDSLGNLVNLNHLWLSHNDFTGSIPAKLGRLTQVIRLNLGNNGFTGSIPEELADMSSLEHLDIYPNEGLTGCVPVVLKDVENHDLDVLELPDCTETD